MSDCNNECNTCTRTCSPTCPICNKMGKKVDVEVLKSLVNKNNNLIIDAASFICINRKCDCIYFQEGNPKYFIKDDVKVPIWFKSSLKSQIICYCHNIKLIDIVNIVNNSNEEDLTKEKIFKLLNIIDKDDCIHHNPLGESCDKLFKNAIEFAYKQKENKNLINN